ISPARCARNDGGGTGRSDRAGRLAPPLVGRLRRPQPRDLENLLLVERVALEQRRDERVELLAVRDEQPLDG
ncbi:MAG TPA: hypothetical protein VK025_05690, partial [Steroidobacter sp.]|nr:hypothetical protein [Steroidobacter sp.]